MNKDRPNPLVDLQNFAYACKKSGFLPGLKSPRIRSVPEQEERLRQLRELHRCYLIQKGIDPNKIVEPELACLEGISHVFDAANMYWNPAPEEAIQGCQSEIAKPAVKNSVFKAFSLPVALEWAGCTFGLLGAFILALHNANSGYGFIAFLASNFCWILFARRINASGLLLMQLGFTATSLLGVYKWIM